VAEGVVRLLLGPIDFVVVSIDLFEKNLSVLRLPCWLLFPSSPVGFDSVLPRNPAYLLTAVPTASDSRADAYRQVTDQVIAMLEAGTAPWHMPWNTEAGLPRSLSTGKPYRGINLFLSQMSAIAAGYSSPWGNLQTH